MIVLVSPGGHVEQGSPVGHPYGGYVVEVGLGVVDAMAAATCKTRMKMANPLSRVREGPLLIIALIEELARGTEDLIMKSIFNFIGFLLTSMRTYPASK